MNRSENIGELISALAKAQLKFGAAKKDSENPYYGSKYADLGAVIGAVRPALAEQGIALMHTLESDLERQVAIVTVGLYREEQFISETIEAPAVSKGKDGQPKFDVQTLGAAWSYLRRYSIQSICGLASEDDDGNSLQNDNKPIPAKKGKDSATHQAMRDATKGPQQVQQGEYYPDQTATVDGKTVSPAIAERAVRSGFLKSAQGLGWGLGEVKAYLGRVFPDAKSTASLTVQQLKDTLEAFGQVKPEEFFFTDDDGTIPESVPEQQ